MPRYKVVLECDGTKFAGFQTQPHQITVQSTLEAALQQISAKASGVVCAGRTDAGVHARYQVVHFDIDLNLPNPKMRDALNYHLHSTDIAVVNCENLGEESSFHARFDAKERWYEYKILQQYHPPTFNKHLYWWLKPYGKLLNIENMQQAAKYLEGTHDFTTFRSSGCGANSPIRTVNSITITEQVLNPINHNFISEINIVVKAQSFLYHQVRNIVGALVLVGQAKWTPLQLKQALEAKQSSLRIKVAPAHGLYFINVIY